MTAYRLARFRGVAHLIHPDAGSEAPALCGARPRGFFGSSWDFSEQGKAGAVCIVCQWAEFEEKRKEKREE